jgi:putative addiction module killer protein
MAGAAASKKPSSDSRTNRSYTKRIAHIQDDGYFGDYKDVDDDVWELKWKNGRRVYYACIPEKKILLLLGGNKNGQDKDIRQAKKILRKHVSFEE